MQDKESEHLHNYVKLLWVFVHLVQALEKNVYEYPKRTSIDECAINHTLRFLEIEVFTSISNSVPIYIVKKLSIRIIEAQQSNIFEYQQEFPKYLQKPFLL